MFYLGKHSGRKLQWQATLGHSVLKAEFKEVGLAFSLRTNRNVAPRSAFHSSDLPFGDHCFFVIVIGILSQNPLMCVMCILIVARYWL